jgi:hypothetical protein
VDILKIEDVGASFSAGDYSWWEATEFDSTGELTSSVLDTGGEEALAKLNWTSVEPVGTGLLTSAIGVLASNKSPR